jgi:hypothetical protein
MNIQECKNPAALAGATGSDKCALLGGIDTQDATAKPHVTQARIDLLADDITDTAGWLIDQLNCLPAQRVAGDTVGIIYTLRRSRAYWRHISESAAELAGILKGKNDRPRISDKYIAEQESRLGRLGKVEPANLAPIGARSPVEPKPQISPALATLLNGRRATLRAWMLQPWG